jgi:hypothetical protein
MNTVGSDFRQGQVGGMTQDPANRSSESDFDSGGRSNREQPSEADQRQGGTFVVTFILWALSKPPRSRMVHFQVIVASVGSKMAIGTGRI